MIEAVIERCAGIDVGKKFVLVCVMTGGAKDEPQTEIKKFDTIVSELDRLAQWLVAEGCTHAVMESTGSYWKPIFNLLEAHLRVILANAADVQNRRGHKTAHFRSGRRRQIDPFAQWERCVWQLSGSWRFS